LFLNKFLYVINCFNDTRPTDSPFTPWVAWFLDHFVLLAGTSRHCTSVGWCCHNSLSMTVLKAQLNVERYSDGEEDRGASPYRDGRAERCRNRPGRAPLLLLYLLHVYPPAVPEDHRRQAQALSSSEFCYTRHRPHVTSKLPARQEWRENLKLFVTAHFYLKV
jgi:hypothetical protein